MGDFNRGVVLNPVMGPINSVGDTTELGQILRANGQALSNVTQTANVAVLTPFNLSDWMTISLLWWVNGVTTVSGNCDCGIYDAVTLAKIVSTGSTAQAGTGIFQTVDVADTLLGPGHYFLAFAIDNATGTVKSNTSVSANLMQAVGVKQMASAFPLPSTITPAAPTITTMPQFGAELYQGVV